MNFSKFENLKKPSFRGAFCSSLSALFIVALAFIQLQASSCEMRRSDSVIYKTMVLSNTQNQFGLLWTLQFLNRSAFDKSRASDRTATTKLIANEFKEEQQSLLQAYNQSCIIWDELTCLFVVLALIFQAMATYFVLSAAASERSSSGHRA